MTEVLARPALAVSQGNAHPAGEDEPRLKVLVADDAATERMILASIVRKAGFNVVTAVDGRDALAKFTSERPDILLLDVMMPHFDGKEVARRVRASLGQEILPIIFVTSLSEPTDLAECLDAGGDDFLSKPYNQIVISAKLSVYRRLRLLHGMLQHQAKAMAHNNAHLIQEQEVAKAVFDRVIHTGDLAAPNIRFLLSPLAVFNGDVLLAGFQPSGNMHVMLADFTGHGLPAAIGAIPLAETFYSMTRKGFELEDIIEEANAKLRHVLPVGVFSCCAALSLDFRKQRLRLWLGGLPDCVLYRANGEYECIASSHLPLGILDSERFRSTCTVRDVEPGDRLLMWSDGIVEAQDAEGELFGEDRVIEIIERAAAPQDVYQNLVASVNRHIGASERNDDITIVECTMMGPDAMQRAAVENTVAPPAGLSDVSLRFELGPESLKSMNPIPLIVADIMQISGLRYFSGEIQTILAELFSNALEHGVLGLKSALKQAPNGFAAYYSERTERLLALREGHVAFELKHVPDELGGRLTMIVSDSGDGFDPKSLKPAAGDKSKYCGRGVSLLTELCESVRHLDNGSTTEVVFRWIWPESLRPDTGSANGHD